MIMSNSEKNSRNKIIDIVVFAALIAVVLYCAGYMRGSGNETERSEDYHVSIRGQENDAAGEGEQQSVPYTDGFLPINVLTRCNGWSKEISLYASDGVCYAFLPAYAEQTELACVFDDALYEVELSGRTLASGELLQDIEPDTAYELTIVDRERNSLQLTLMFLQSQNLPSVFIDTQSGSMDYVDAYKGNEESGQFCCVTAQGEIDSQSTMNVIKGRGNTSWEGKDAKNQYNVQLAEATDILHMGAAVNWVVQANKLDASMLRNKLAYDFAKDVGIPYAVDSEFADLYLNGRYMGTYLVCEKVEVAPNRVDIGGGYLLEVNFRGSEEETMFATNCGTFLINSPELISEEQYRYIADYVSRAADSMIAAEQSDAYLDYIDLDSFAKLYIMDEIGDDPDNNALSTFYYKADSTDAAKLTAGPVWDFDISFGNDERSSETLCSYYGEGWFEYLYRSEAFRDRVAELLRDVMERCHDRYADHYFEDMEEYMRASYHMNEIRWKEKQGYIASFYAGYEENMSYLDDYFMTRLENLNRVFNGTGKMHKVEFRDRGRQYAHAFVADGEIIPAKVIDFLQSVDGASSWRTPDEQLIDPASYVVYGDVSISRKPPVSETTQAESGTAGASADQMQNEEKGELAMQWISFIMLMVPGLISVWVSGNTKLKKENAFAVLSQYLFNSFIVLLLSYGIFYVLYGSALLSFSDSYNAAYDYSIFNVNVTFKYLLLAGALSVAVGLAERILFASLGRRKASGR